MPDLDPRLGLALPIVTDDFDTAEIRSNWEKLRDHPGIRVVDNTAGLPSWGSAHAGMYVYQKDADILWRWNGSAFVSWSPKGHLGTTRRTTNLVVSGGTDTIIVQQVVSVPSGGRNVAVKAAWCEITGGVARLTLYRGATKLVDWKCSGDGGSFEYVDLAPSAGTTTYSFRMRNAAAAVTMVASAASSASIMVIGV